MAIEEEREPLKVYQLIEELSHYDKELPVILSGYEYGTEPLLKEHIELKYVDTADGADWAGDYGDAEDTLDRMESPMLAVLLRR